MDQIGNFVKKSSVKSTRELQDEVIEEVAGKVRDKMQQL